MKDEGTTEEKNNQFKMQETQERNENNSKSNLQEVNKEHKAKA